MKKRILSILAAAVLFLLIPMSFAGADYDSSSYWDSSANAYLYNTPHYGIVLCTKMSVRNKPSTSGTAYGTIRNGQPVKILGVSQDGNFYLLDIASCSITTTKATRGFAKASLIKKDPEFIQASRLLNLYATPWGDGLKNGEQNNRFFLIISQNYNWYAVQSTESTPGSAFIRTGDVSPTYNHTKYVITWDAELRDEDTMAALRTVRRFTVGRLLKTSQKRSLLVFNEGTDSEYRGWVLTQFTAPVIN